jgi:hypothetical protein
MCIRDRFKYQYSPVPINVEFTLYVFVGNQEDGTKIIEQIVPFFTPDWSSTVHLIPELNISVDIPIILGQVTKEDLFEGAYADKRTIIWTLPFVLKGYLYGPIKSKPIIKFVHENFYFGNPADNSNTDVVSTILVEPGLTANGDPTTNSALTIDPLLIDVDDDWDYIVEKSGIVINFE